MTSWPRVFAGFYVSHQVGDYLIQTEWQARNKAAGLGGDRRALSALLAHSIVYTLCFAPGLATLAQRDGRANAAIIAGLIFVPHVIIDDRRLVRGYARRVKRIAEGPDPSLLHAVDQAVHVVSLWGAAMVAEKLSER